MTMIIIIIIHIYDDNLWHVIYIYIFLSLLWQIGNGKGILPIHGSCVVPLSLSLLCLGIANTNSLVVVVVIAVPRTDAPLETAPFPPQIFLFSRSFFPPPPLLSNTYILLYTIWCPNHSYMYISGTINSYIYIYI